MKTARMRAVFETRVAMASIYASESIDLGWGLTSASDVGLKAPFEFELMPVNLDVS